MTVASNVGFEVACLYPEGVSYRSPGFHGLPGYPGFEIGFAFTLKGLHFNNTVECVTPSG